MSQQPFGDIPLFREIQRLLASSGSGPLNLEIASQVAIAIATEGRPENPIGQSTVRTLADTVHASESLLAGFTRLPLTESIRAEGFNRTGWVNKTLVAWRWLLEHLARRFLDLSSAQDADDAATQQMTTIMKQVGPLLMGLQAGTLVGHLAREVISGYDPSIPREGEQGIVLVVTNLEQLATDYSIDVNELARWFAVQETARHLVVQGVGWVAPYRKNLITELVDSIEIDTGELERRLIDLQSGEGLEALQQGTPVDGSIPLVRTPRHEVALERVRAFVGLHEGYAARAAATVGPELLSESSKIEEIAARHKGSASDAKALLANVLGFSLDRDLVSTGQTFCAAVEKLEGITALNTVWLAPDNLPTYAELRDPFLWIGRVLEQGEPS